MFICGCLANWFQWESRIFSSDLNVLIYAAPYTEMAFIAENYFSLLVFCTIFVLFYPLMLLFLIALVTICFLTGRLVCRPTVMRICKLQRNLIGINLSFKSVFNASFVLRESFYNVGVSIVSWSGFPLKTTLLFAFRRNRSRILFQLYDTADDCSIDDIHCSNHFLRFRFKISLLVYKERWTVKKYVQCVVPVAVVFLLSLKLPHFSKLNSLLRRSHVHKCLWWTKDN